MTNTNQLIDDQHTRTRARVPTVDNPAGKTAVSGPAREAELPAEEDPIERITRVVPLVVPIVGGVLIFLLAFIAVYMA